MNSNITTTAPAEYLLIDGEIACNESGRQVQKNFHDLQDKVYAIDATHAGTIILYLLFNAPWMKSVKLNLNAESEYDDQGGSYRSIYGSFSELTVVEGFSLPSDLLGESGILDDYAATSLLNVLMENVEGYFEIYNALTDRHEYADFDIEIDRSKAEAILASGYLSGIEAFKVFFPDHASLLELGESSQTEPDTQP